VGTGIKDWPLWSIARTSFYVFLSPPAYRYVPLKGLFLSRIDPSSPAFLGTPNGALLYRVCSTQMPSSLALMFSFFLAEHSSSRYVPSTDAIVLHHSFCASLVFCASSRVSGVLCAVAPSLENVSKREPFRPSCESLATSSQAFVVPPR